MAKIILGPIVQSVSGSIGSITFRKIGSGNYATLKSAGPVSPGKNSGAHQALLRQVTASWLDLDPAIREFWDRYHGLAKPRNPRTGKLLPTHYSLYTCYQLMRLHCGVSMLTASVPDPPIFSYGTLTWDGPFWQAGAGIQGTSRNRSKPIHAPLAVVPTVRCVWLACIAAMIVKGRGLDGRTGMQGRMWHRAY